MIIVSPTGGVRPVARVPNRAAVSGFWQRGMSHLLGQWARR